MDGGKDITMHSTCSMRSRHIYMHAHVAPVLGGTLMSKQATGNVNYSMIGRVTADVLIWDRVKHRKVLEAVDLHKSRPSTCTRQ